jgi:hypothetical protein
MIAKVVNKAKSISKGYLYNYRGWKTNRKIVVIESDDWGGERTPNKEVFLKLLKMGLRVDNCAFSKFDTIESKEDLSALFEVLNSVKDLNNCPAVLTANFNLANPDFQKIKESDFAQYFYIDYKATLEKYNRIDVLETINQGVKSGVFFPQSHSREHMSPYLWLDEIKNKNNSLKKAFDLDVYGLSRATSPEIVKFHLASQLYRNEQELEFVSHAFQDGLKLFESNFGYQSLSFIAPVYTWNEANETIMNQNGIKFIQSSFFQNYFKPYEIDSFSKKFHYTGQKNIFDQIYTVRNCLFEPSLSYNKDCVPSCLEEIKNSFFMNKPAIISSHRLNYIGELDEKNRENNLKQLKRLLFEIKNRWSDVEFMTSVELGKLIANEVFIKND